MPVRRAVEADSPAIVVAPTRQRRSLGGRLLAELRAVCRTHGVTTMRAHVRADNLAMVRLLRHHGTRSDAPAEAGELVFDISSRDDTSR